MFDTHLTRDPLSDDGPRPGNALCYAGSACGFRKTQCLCGNLFQIFGISNPPGLHRLELDTGNTILPENLPNDPILAFHTGTVGLEVHLSDGRRTISGLFFPGDYLDVAPFGRKFDGTLTALAPTIVHIIDRIVFEQLLASKDEMQDHYLAYASATLQRMMSHANDLAKKTPIERMAAFIFEIRTRAGSPKDAKKVALPFGRRDIADYLGLQPETVSRALSALTNEGAISLPEINLVSIEDSLLLRQIANGGRPRKRGD